MEAQGMVAIVQGLRDAGLTVTLIGDRRARRLATLKQSSLPHARFSVETSTKEVAATVSCVDTAAQICDGRYTSSYQLAHCMARPSSPPVRLAEFPPQRTEPCRTQGNFEVGGLSSAEIHPALLIPTHCEDYLRNSFTNDDRGFLSKRHSSRGTQEFVHSLRKYPSLSPNRSVSSELVQRLIAYTQAKNFTKRSNSKSMRSLRNQNADPPKETNPRTKVSKSVQTYTRAKRRKENVPPVEDRDGRNNEDRDVGSSQKKFWTRSPHNMTRNNRSRDIHIPATYDYLKTPSPRRCAAADVRYLTDVTRCLRDTLRQICDDRAVVCPNIQSRYSQHRRQHHRDGVGLQSSAASNNVGAQASSTTASTGVPAMSSCEAIPGTYQQTYSRATKICCRCRKPVPCACGHSSSSVRVQRYPNILRSTSKDKSDNGNLDASLVTRDSELEEQVLNWLKEIPVYANEKLEDKATREKMARHLINELKALQGSNDFDQEARKEIAKCVDNMPMWFPENKEVQDIFKAQIVDNLSCKLSNLNKRKNRFTEEIVQWVDGLDFESRDDGGQFIKKHNVVDNLINKLKPIALNSQPDTEEYKDALKTEIVNAMNELPLKINGDKVTKLNLLADNLASRLSKIPTKYVSLEQQVDLGEQLQTEIWEWLKDIPQFPNSSTLNVMENQKNVEYLAQTLQQLHAKGVDNLETQEQMQNAINEWLEKNIEDKNQIVLRERGYLVDNLIRKLLKLEKEVFRDKPEKSSSTTPSNSLNIIRDWMKHIPDLMSEDEEKNQEIVESLAEKLKEFQSLNKNGTSLEREIFNYLTSMLDKKGKRVHTRNQNDLVRQLIGRLKTAGEVEAIVESDKHVIQDIIDCFSDIPEIDMNLEVNIKIAEQLARKVQSLQTSEQKESNEKKIKDTVVDWLTKITADSGSKLSTTTKNQLVQKLMNIATETHKPRRRWSKMNDSQKVKKSLREEVGYVLDKSGTDFDDQEEMVSILTDILVDQVTRGESDSETRNRILNALKASYITHEQSEGIASRLIKIGKEMSLSFKTQDSSLKFKDRSERISVLSPQQKVTFQESAQKEILDFIEKLIDGGSIVSVDKLKEATRTLAEKIGDIVSMQSTNLDHTRRRSCVEDEILKYLQNLSLQTGVVREQQASLLADRLQNLAIKISTPKRTSFENEFSFRPRRDSTGSTISTINDISQHMHTQAIENEEQQYINQLLNIIDGWMNNLPIDLESDEGKRFKDVMVRDLAGDIVDRQKYLQLNPGAKTSEGEELENLKYQVFRWLNKLPDVKSLLPSVSKADHLMNRIKSLSVPQLKKSPERSSPLARNADINNLSKDLAMLRIEILKWIEAVPDKFYAVSDKKHHLKLVEDLAEQIHDLHKAGTLTESVFDDVSSQWLLKILKEYNDYYFNSLIEGLKGILISKKLITLEISNLMEGTSHDLQDKLNSVILDWLKEQALYRRRNSKEKREQEQIVAELSNNLREALKLIHSSQVQRDIMLLNEIKLHIKKFPMDAHLKLDDEFHSTVAVELLEYLKFLQMIHEDSEKHSQALFDLIFNTIEEWTNSLPLQVRKTSAAHKELEDLKNLKREFAATIQNVREQYPSPTEFRDQHIREEIKKYWHAFPIEPAKKKDQNFTSKKVNDLHAKLIALGNLEKGKELPFEKDTIYTIILKWTKNLQPKKRIAKSQIDQLATKIEERIANVLPNDYNSIRSNLEKEVKTFVARLSLQNNKLKESQVRELINNITEFYKCNLSEDHSIANTSPQLQTIYNDNSVNSEPGFKKAADILYENIENWCDNLPLQEGSTPEEKEKVKTLKQNIASKLINVIGDLNMKPEIFNDDSLYEDLLNDEIDNLLSNLPLNPMLERNIPALKDNLVGKVKEVRQKTQEELAGQAYKQQLREAISRNLPSVENLTLEEQAPFEELKDNVADAYIELYYATNNDGMKTKLKTRISNEINNFCNDYLKRYPASPIYPETLNSELYGVLRKIPIPKDETIKSQVEQVRIKDKINNWIKELPLKKEENPSEKLHRKKIVAILAKDLHDIEKEKEPNPHIGVGYLMEKEIKKWIKKLPIQPNQEDSVEQMVEKLVSKLISTEKSRELCNFYIRHNADLVEQENAKPPSIKTLPLSTYVPHLPPSTLSTEDRAHLQRIRERNQQKQTNCMPCYSPRQYKDASVSPIPIDTGSQADLEGTQWQTTSAKTTQSCESSPMHSNKSIQSQSSPYNQSPISQSSKRRECPGPEQAISPQVVVREYYWDSTNEGQAQDPSVIPYAVSEQQGYAEKTLPGHQPPNQTYRNQSPANQSGRPLTSQQSPSRPQKFVTSSERMEQTMIQKFPFVTPQLSPHRKTQCAPRMTTPVESPQPFMTSQPPCPHQSTMQSSQRSMPQPNMASGLPEKSLYVPQQPIQTPCMAEPNSATPAPPHLSPRHYPPFVPQETPREVRRRRTSKPYFASREISGTSSPFDTDIPEAETRTRVTRLGSLDDVPYTKTCGSQSPKPKRSRTSPNEDSDWTIRFPEDTGFWGTPCPRRRPHRTPQREGSYVKEKERKEEKMRCRCQERTRTKCMGRRPETCHQSHNHPIQPDFMNQCPKCCGVHCPHPSYLFFR